MLFSSSKKNVSSPIPTGSIPGRFAPNWLLWVYQRALCTASYFVQSVRLPWKWGSEVIWCLWNCNALAASVSNVSLPTLRVDWIIKCNGFISIQPFNVQLFQGLDWRMPFFPHVWTVSILWRWGRGVGRNVGPSLGRCCCSVGGGMVWAVTAWKQQKLDPDIDYIIHIYIYCQRELSGTTHISCGM